MTTTNIRKLGLSIVVAGVSAFMLSRVKAGKVTCCNDPATCLCELNQNILYDIVREVRLLPE